MDQKIEVKTLLDQLSEVQALAKPPSSPEIKLEKHEVENFVIQQ